jgi:hypothetical protein
MLEGQPARDASTVGGGTRADDRKRRVKARPLRRPRLRHISEILRDHGWLSRAEHDEDAA